MDVDSGRIVIGASRSNSDVGRAVVYEEDATGAWVRTASLQPATQTKRLFFGASVALSGDRIAVGAPAGPINPANSGRVRIFDLDQAGAWVMTKIVKPNQPLSSGAHFGTDVALSGDTLLASAPFESGAPVWAFRKDLGGPNKWGVSLKHTPGGSLEVVAVDGDRALIGSPIATLNGI